MSDRLYRLAPGEIHVGQGAIDKLPEITTQLGGPCLIIHDAGGRETAAESSSRIAEAGVEARTLPFAGECTEVAIDRICAEISSGPLLAFGGGKVLDAAKAAASDRHVSCITVPTSAATCAAYTPLSILHESDGAYVVSRRLHQPVAALLLDPNVLVAAPPRLLAAGMADAAARAFDTILAARIHVPTATAAMSLAICRAYLFETLLTLGDGALADNEKRSPSEAFTRAIEACIVGAGLAGETGARFFGRSFSHAVAYALSHVVNADGVLHGEAAGLGILVHCLIDPNPPIPFEAMQERFAGWGLPISFAEVGIDGLEGNAGRSLAERAHAYLDLERAIPFDVTPKGIHRGMVRVDEEARRT